MNSTAAQAQSSPRRMVLLSVTRRVITALRARVVLWVAASLMIALPLISGGCGNSEDKPDPAPASGKSTGTPVLKAEPNPVPKSDKMGKTTITWNTGDGSWGQVYVSENGGTEKLFQQERS